MGVVVRGRNPVDLAGTVCGVITHPVGEIGDVIFPADIRNGSELVISIGIVENADIVLSYQPIYEKSNQVSSP